MPTLTTLSFLPGKGRVSAQRWRGFFGAGQEYTPRHLLAPPDRFAHRAPMRNPLRTLLIVLAIVVLAIVILQFLPNERPVGPVEQDVTNELVGG